MGAPNLDLLRFLEKTFDIKTFVETGSGHGATALEAVKIFPLVHTIELSDSLYEETQGLLGQTAMCYHGKSAEVLSAILPQIYGPAVYWLDAHWSGGPTAGEQEQCPLLGELEEINRREMNHDFILIDDAHVFFSPAVLKPPHILEHWPSLMQIFTLLNKKDRYTVVLSSWRCVEHGLPGGIVMPEDVIISVPSYAKDRLYYWLLNLNLEH